MSILLPVSSLRPLLCPSAKEPDILSAAQAQASGLNVSFDTGRMNPQRFFSAARDPVQALAPYKTLGPELTLHQPLRHLSLRKSLCCSAQDFLGGLAAETSVFFRRLKGSQPGQSSFNAVGRIIGAQALGADVLNAR